VKGNKPLTKEEFIQRIIRSKTLVIVEGFKDIAKLKKLGVSRVISLSRMPLCNFCEKLSQEQNEVILLMDNDIEGKKLYSKLKIELTRLRIKFNPKYQRMLAQLKVSHVEGL